MSANTVRMKQSGKIHTVGKYLKRPREFERWSLTNACWALGQVLPDCLHILSVQWGKKPTNIAKWVLHTVKCIRKKTKTKNGTNVCLSRKQHACRLKRIQPLQTDLKVVYHSWSCESRSFEGWVVCRAGNTQEAYWDRNIVFSHKQ